MSPAASNTSSDSVAARLLSVENNDWSPRAEEHILIVHSMAVGMRDKNSAEGR